MDRLLMLFAQLQELLEEERTALLAGEPERITVVAQQKRALADAIEETAAQSTPAWLNPEELRRLARYNRENSVICSAMLRHMTEAIDKLRRYEPHRSYRADGTERAQAVRNTLGAA